MAERVKTVSSVMQLSTFTKITSIPSEENYNDFPVTVSVKALDQMTVPRCRQVDIVALIDISGSMGKSVTVSDETTTKLKQEKKAMDEVIRYFGGKQNRLALVAFNDGRRHTKLEEMTDEWQKEISEKLRKPTMEADGETDISYALAKATEILDGRTAEEKERLAFIILFTDGADRDLVKIIPPAYPIHGFGFWPDPLNDDERLLENLCKLTSGSYTRVDEALEQVTEQLGKLCNLQPSSMVALDTRISLKSMHPGVTLSRIESSADQPSCGSQISQGKESGEIFVGVVSPGEKIREFTVFLNVPEGQGNGPGGNMELLTVGGRYKQSWDQQQVGLAESVVTVARPQKVCKELHRIEKRLHYWCQVKQDLTAMYDHKMDEESAGGNECQLSETLREESLAAIDRAMHHDICVAVQHALIELRQCGNGGGGERECTITHNVA